MVDTWSNLSKSPFYMNWPVMFISNKTFLKIYFFVFYFRITTRNGSIFLLIRPIKLIQKFLFNNFMSQWNKQQNAILISGYFFFFTKSSISNRVLHGIICFIKINYIILIICYVRNALQVCLEDICIYVIYL